MKKINNKGFTLVELLAVLVILITILMIAVPSITAAVERNKQKALEKKIDIIEAGVETWVNQYKNKITNYDEFKNGNCCIYTSRLVEVGFFDSEELEDADDKDIIGYVCLENNNYVYHSSGKTACTIKN